jgi:hypothetical protein
LWSSGLYERCRGNILYAGTPYLIFEMSKKKKQFCKIFDYM